MPELTAPTRSQLAAAWAEGVSETADIHGDVTADCPFDQPDLAEAWRDGARRARDWDGRADLSENPYED